LALLVFFPGAGALGLTWMIGAYAIAFGILFEHLGARVFPDMFSLAQAHQALDAAGTIANPQLSDRFEQNIVAFIDLVEAAKHYPCAKKAWIEFLGEQPDPATERVE